MAPNAIHVWPEERKATDESVQVSAVIELPKKRHQLCYEIPRSAEALVADNADCLAIASVFLAMRRNLPLLIHGRVSPTLLQNLEGFQAVWSTWFPQRYQEVTLRADVEGESHSQPGDAAVVAFSGGVDSCYTVYRHVNRLCGRRSRVFQAAIMVHGFDIPTESSLTFEKACVRSRRVLDDVNLQLIPVKTNWRSLRVNWEYGHGAGLASVLSLLSASSTYGLIGSTEPFSSFIPWGSNPLTDRMLSSSTFQIVHDAAECTRLQKVEALIGWPESIANLRVCWEGRDPSSNCGTCEKCIRTILNFRVLGQPTPECFERDVTLRQIATVQIRNATQRNEFALIYQEVLARNLAGEAWAKELHRRLLAYDARTKEERSSQQRRSRTVRSWGRAVLKRIATLTYPKRHNKV